MMKEKKKYLVRLAEHYPLDYREEIEAFDEEEAWEIFLQGINLHVEEMERAVHDCGNCMDCLGFTEEDFM